MNFFEITTALFFVINPVGNSPFILSLLAPFDSKTQHQILFRELSLGLLLALFFVYAGEPFLSLLGIDRTTIGICGGVILFLIALSLIFPKREAPGQKKLARIPYFVPIATPVLAGPCVLTTVMLYSKQVEGQLTLAAALTLAWLMASVVVMAAPTVQQLFGRRGMIALEQLMGMLLVFLSLDMLVTSLLEFVAQRIAYS